MADKSTLLYPVDKLKPGEEALQAFPELASYDAFAKHGADDQFVRFVIFYCDKGSDYQRLPLDKKKRDCLARVGITPSHPRYQDVLKWKDKAVAEMTVDYLRLQDWIEYETLFAAREHIRQLTAMMLTPVPDGMDGDKEQRTYSTKNTNTQFALSMSKEIEERWLKLWMSADEIKQAANRKIAEETGSVEKRAVGQTFVPRRS